MYCIYHSRDLDGFTSAAIVKRRYPEAILIGYDYGQPVPEIPEGEVIFMVDVSMPMTDMHALAIKSGYNLTWIDHHVSAIDEYASFLSATGIPEFMYSYLRSGTAACELTWEYLFPNKPIPKSVLLLGEYDTWRRSDEERWNDKILPFQYGMRQICNSPETFDADLFDNVPTAVSQITRDGKVILGYQARISELLCKRIAFPAQFAGYSAICLNGTGLSSDTFKSVYDESKHDIMMTFAFDGNKWIVSMYTTKEDVDVSILAKSHGGGGHKKAAGFESNDFPVFYANK